MSFDRLEELYRLLGTDDLAQAIENIEGERQGMRELHDENTALKIYNRRLRLLVDFGLQIYDVMERDVGMFLPEKARTLIAKSREQIAQAEKAIKGSIDIVNL